MPLRSHSQCVDPECPDHQPEVTGIQNSDFGSPRQNEIPSDTCPVPVNTLALGWMILVSEAPAQTPTQECTRKQRQIASRHGFL